MTPMKTLIAVLVAGGLAMSWSPALADDDDDAEEEAAAEAPGQAFGERTVTLGFAGVMDRRNREDLEEITLTAGEMQSAGEYELLSGSYYTLAITSDGTQELAVEGPDFFRNVWVNEVVINDIEVRPLGLDSIEFDAAGTARISFVAIRPGTFEFRIRGTTGETQMATFHIR